MSQAKKFGAFAGVYTPSLLTILGVIMYMRLGWIVGNAGIYTMMGIVIIAHVISFTTGLSISSIATDKRIKSGGIYYILSRSLGLPMGGSIGITLAIATALSISLYIIGFAESFLSIQAIADFLHLTPGVEAFRIVGTIVIVLLVVLAFISTSLAIKTQYFILGAIVLSLISIAGGFYFHPEFHPASPLLNPAENAKPIEYLFAIFFPAVTGFTAGVAMSGDLKNPKKDIPMGTMAAIISGFVVYIALSIALGVFVNRDTLINNLDFISKIAWVPALIFAGIWGATLSSALGGILGGPRILQAVAQDSILPKFVAKGHGEANEPRNALILIFIIAEAGILVGQLNVIAGVVSMFYLASYGFINMAFALESWASTDFRPTFKVPRWIGVLGAIAAFLVMFKLDPVSMAVAFIIMWGIFFLLKRKELRLDFGDVWQSVWAGIVRTALFRLEKQEIEERNWRPNIILFSGGQKVRRHLIELGKNLVGSQGLISNFELVERSDNEFLFSKEEQRIGAEGAEAGVFMRKHSVTDIYEGIELISATYGFSGLEPNTVMLGWARQSKNPERFTQLLKRLNQLDFNVLLVDYDKKRGFGKHKIIDIWWEDKSRDNNLALKLSKFLSNSDEWHHASIRLQVVNSMNKNADLIHRNTQSIFDELRMDVQLRIINNEIEQTALYEIILRESANADLIFMGMPDLHKGEEAEFVELTNKLLPEIGTVIIVSAASRFKRLSIQSAQNKDIIQLSGMDTTKIKLKLPENKTLAGEFSNFFNLNEISGKQYMESIVQQNQVLDSFFVKVKTLLFTEFNFILERYENTGGKLPNSFYYKKVQTILNKVASKLNTLEEEFLENYNQNIDSINKKWLSDYQVILDNLPSIVPVIITKNVARRLLENAKNRKERNFARKVLRYITIFGHPYKLSFKFAKYLKRTTQKEFFTAFMQIEYLTAKANVKAWVDVQQLVQLFSTKVLSLSNAEYKELSISDFKTDFEEKIVEFEQRTLNLREAINEQYNIKISEIVQKSIDVHIGYFSSGIKINNGYKKTVNNLKSKILESTTYKERDHRIMFKNLMYTILFEKTKITLSKLQKDILTQILNEIIVAKDNQTDEIIQLLESSAHKEQLIENEEISKYEKVNIEFEIKEFLNQHLETISKKIKKIIARFPAEDELLTTEEFNRFTELMFSPLEMLNIKSSALVNYLLEDEFIDRLNLIYQQFSQKLIEHYAEIGESIRIIPYSLKNLGSETIELEQFLEKQKSRLDENKEQIKLLYQDFEGQFTQINTNIQTKLSLYSFSSIAQNYRQYIREQVSRKGLVRVKQKLKQLQKAYIRFFNKVIYQGSKAVLYAKKLNAININKKNKINQLLELGSYLSVQESVNEKMPFYYKQLFTGDNNFFHDFWMGREKDILDAKKALKYYQAGNHGAFLILGEYNSGKSFMAQYLSKNIFESNTVYRLEAPSGGSIIKKDFLLSLQQLTGIKATVDGIFTSLPENTSLIIDDLELWWERSDKGYSLIKKIHQWIEKYAYKIKFIVTANMHSFEFMDQRLDLSKDYLHVFQTNAFSSEQLRDAILRRHKASGFQLEFKKSRFIKGFEQARYFNKLFNLTHGVIGEAMMLWLASVSEVNKDYIELREPEKPGLQVLDYLTETDWAIIITVILHREMKHQKLMNQFNGNEKVVQSLSFLLRAGVLKHKTQYIYVLNKQIYPFLRIKLFEKELI